jgi:hypothetical protein
LLWQGRHPAVFVMYCRNGPGKFHFFSSAKRTSNPYVLLSLPELQIPLPLLVEDCAFHFS